jgi:hypothetical protein
MFETTLGNVNVFGKMRKRRGYERQRYCENM